MGCVYKPRGSFTSNAPATTDTAPAPATVAQAPVATPAATVAVSEHVASTDVPFEADDAPEPTAAVTTPASGGQRAEDILAMIRNRQKTA